VGGAFTPVPPRQPGFEQPNQAPRAVLILGPNSQQQPQPAAAPQQQPFFGQQQTASSSAGAPAAPCYTISVSGLL